MYFERKTNSSQKSQTATAAHLDHLHAHEFEAFHLEPLDDLADDAPLHAIGLDGNEGTLELGSHDSETKRFKN